MCVCVCVCNVQSTLPEMTLPGTNNSEMVATVEQRTGRQDAAITTFVLIIQQQKEILIYIYIYIYIQLFDKKILQGKIVYTVDENSDTSERFAIESVTLQLKHQYSQQTFLEIHSHTFAHVFTMQRSLINHM